MKILEINDLEIDLQGDQTFIYSEAESEVLNIENIEHIDKPERFIIDKLSEYLLYNNTPLPFYIIFSISLVISFGAFAYAKKLHFIKQDL